MDPGFPNRGGKKDLVDAAHILSMKSSMKSLTAGIQGTLKDPGSSRYLDLEARTCCTHGTDPPLEYAVKTQTSLAPLSRIHGSRVTTAHAHQCCIFHSYAKTVPSRMKLTMKLTMREPTFMGSMVRCDHGM